jgi:hypothetical protein
MTVVFATQSLCSGEVELARRDRLFLTAFWEGIGCKGSHSGEYSHHRKDVYTVGSIYTTGHSHHGAHSQDRKCSYPGECSHLGVEGVHTLESVHTVESDKVESCFALLSPWITIYGHKVVFVSHYSTSHTAPRS